MTKQRVATAIWVSTGVVAVLVVGVLAALLVGAAHEGGAAGNGQKALNTVAVKWTSLQAATELAGTLAFGDPRSLSLSGGILTGLPSPGDVIEPGRAILEIENRPMILLPGGTVVWRTIGPGVVGPDVLGLRHELADLGIDVGDGGNDEYDQSLSDAIGDLYRQAGYLTPSQGKAALDAEMAAQEVVGNAEESLEVAKDALSEARRGPTAVQRLAADQAVAAAMRDLERAESQLTVAESSAGDSEDLVDLRDAVSTAHEAYALAIASQEALNAPSDTSTEARAVDLANEALADAQAKLHDSYMNDLNPQDVFSMSQGRAIRIESVFMELGETANGEILSWTGTTLGVQADLSEAQRGWVAVGAMVQVKLSDQGTADGYVAALVPPSQDPVTGAQVPARVQISIADQAKVQEIGPSGVTLTFEGQQAGESLVVPVIALLALSEGGYAVELPDGSLLPVRIGVVADTEVQIYSPELHAGDRVVVP